MTAEEVAKAIVVRSTGETYVSTVADPSMFATSGGPSLAERMAREGVLMRPGDNRRVAQRGSMGGWDQLRARMRGDGEVPMLYVFQTCRDFIRTVPALQHDPDRMEDLDTAAEDHAADEARYACMSRPWNISTEKFETFTDPAGKLKVRLKAPKVLPDYTYDEFFDACGVSRLNERHRNRN